MLVHNATTWPWPLGAWVGHSVCIVRQVLGSSHKCFFFHGNIMDVRKYIYMCFHLVCFFNCFIFLVSIFYFEDLADFGNVCNIVHNVGDEGG